MEDADKFCVYTLNVKKQYNTYYEIICLFSIFYLLVITIVTFHKIRKSILIIIHHLDNGYYVVEIR